MSNMKRMVFVVTMAAAFSWSVASSFLFYNNNLRHVHTPPADLKPLRRCGSLLAPSCRYTIGRHRSQTSSASISDSSCSDTEPAQAATSSSLSSANAKTGLYVHIPFCQRRCRYCDFAIVPSGVVASDGTLQRQRQEEAFLAMNRNYTRSVLKELQGIARSTKGRKIPLHSIYFGGGTPSLAPMETLESIVKAILHAETSPFDFANDSVEITIEMDPGTFTLEKLMAIKELGFNRVSLGVQSFDDDILAFLGRSHTVRDVYEALDMLQQVFGTKEGECQNDEEKEPVVNYSLDLISGLPGLSLAKFAETLEIAVNLHPQPVHISLYDLQVESGTVFGTWYETNNDRDTTTENERPAPSFHRTKDEAPVRRLDSSPSTIRLLPSEADCAFMYKYASGYLRAKGYEHYEVSSYALLRGKHAKEHGCVSPFRSQHNQVYWATDSMWYALGMGATSFVDGHLTSRPRKLVDYVNWVDLQAKQQQGLTWTTTSTEPSEASDSAVLSDSELLTDVVLKRLRTSEGLSLEWVHHRFPKDGDSYVQSILKGAQLGLELGLASHSQGVLKLVDPGGFLYSNTIISGIFAELTSDTDEAVD